MKKYILTNPNSQFMDNIEYYIDIFGTKKLSVLKQKVLNCPVHLANKSVCYSYNYKTKKLKEYDNYNQLLLRKISLVNDNNKDNFRMYGINLFSQLINFYTDIDNEDSKLLVIQVYDHIPELLNYMKDIGFVSLKKNSINKTVILDIKNVIIDEVILLMKLKFHISSKYDLIYLESNKIIRKSFN